MENLSKSGINDSWNLDGRSLKSETKSSSSSSSIQTGCFGFCSLGFSVLVCLGFVVRSEDFLAVINGFGVVEFSFFIWVLMVGELEVDVGLMSLVLFLSEDSEVEVVGLRILVWFLVEDELLVEVVAGFEVFLMSLVWFLDEEVGMVFVWFSKEVELVEVAFFLIS